MRSHWNTAQKKRASPTKPVSVPRRMYSLCATSPASGGKFRSIRALDEPSPRPKRGLFIHATASSAQNISRPSQFTEWYRAVGFPMRLQSSPGEGMWPNVRSRAIGVRAAAMTSAMTPVQAAIL